MSKSLPENTVTTLDAVADILLRCFIITLGASLFTWFVVLLLGDVIHSVYGQLMEMSRKEFDLFFLYSMTFIKAVNLLFFLFPFIAIKTYLKGKR